MRKVQNLEDLESGGFKIWNVSSPDIFESVKDWMRDWQKFRFIFFFFWLVFKNFIRDKINFSRVSIRQNKFYIIFLRATFFKAFPDWGSHQGFSFLFSHFVAEPHRLPTRRGLYYKTLQIRNLPHMTRFRNKLVSFLLWVTNILAWINTLAYYGICKLQIRSVFIVQAAGNNKLS